MNTAVLILNWNGWEDTIQCLDSLLPILNNDDYLFIVDNGSTDNSVSKLNEYFDTLNEPILESRPENLTLVFALEKKSYLIRNSFNLGFGAGNNSVLRQLSALNHSFEFVWLLNNDTIVLKNSLRSLKNSLQNNFKIGAAGSLLLNYPNNGTVQCSGVKHYRFFGVSKLINKNIPFKDLNKNFRIKFDYLNGASLFLRLDGLNKVGYFDERFFLYSEEYDLELRLQKLGYELWLDLESVVYHQLSGGTRNKKHLFYYYYNSSAILLGKKHFSVLYTCCALINLSIITFVRTFPSFKNFKWGIKGILKGLKNN